MPPWLTVALGATLLTGSLALVLKRYLELPRSGFYNRPEEKARLARRMRVSSAEIRFVILGVVLGLGLIAGGLNG